jgi:hypothetical protein
MMTKYLFGSYRSFGDPNKKGETMAGVSGD